MKYPTTHSTMIALSVGEGNRKKKNVFTTEQMTTKNRPRNIARTVKTESQRDLTIHNEETHQALQDRRDSILKPVPRGKDYLRPEDPSRYAQRLPLHYHI
jgi:hypothetical protein